MTCEPIFMNSDDRMSIFWPSAVTWGVSSKNEESREEGKEVSMGGLASEEKSEPQVEMSLKRELATSKSSGMVRSTRELKLVKILTKELDSILSFHTLPGELLTMGLKSETGWSKLHSEAR